MEWIEVGGSTASGICQSLTGVSSATAQRGLKALIGRGALEQVDK